MVLLSVHVLTFFTACFVVESKPLQDEQYPEGYQLEAIFSHALLRLKHRAYPMSWNEKLEEVATDCIHQLAMSPNGNLYCPAAEGYGVNIFSVTVQNQENEFLGRLAFGMWAEESNRYDFYRPGYNSNTARFTQMIWRSTTDFGFSCIDGSRLGSAFSYCVGIYSPAGNQGDFSVNVLEPYEHK